ncbi:MAG: phosphatidate cytidylyltransferase [Candidatus Auribacterota bacterium]|jgi:phosphatidate cytidylyltransferase|uniref:Phosphatidate cytidylyltransferase n=1 Tax=Candidatus Auribacter fodinae TaxID=2093366 RepID=A0A3A4RC71_9BACT|nr:MAG: hypothetical protein C4541_06580 [Candidatus Auribacter fodinae]
MIKRTISSIFIIAILSYLLVNSQGSLAFAVLLFANILVAFGLLDFMYITNRSGSRLLRTYGLITGVVLHTMLFFRYFFHQPSSELIIQSTALILIGMFLIQLLRQDVRLSIHGICTTITGIVYIVWLFSYFIRILYLPEMDGRLILVALLLITKAGDIFAYIIGSNFGRHKLMPKISPNKTIEGAIGGIAGSVLASVLIFNFTPVPEAFARYAIALGLVLGCFGQLGDLAESMLKRNGQVKDSGEYIPGMGGVLDLLDSILFSAPIMFYFVKYFAGTS